MIPLLYFLSLSGLALLIYKFMSWRYHNIEKKMKESAEKSERDRLKDKMNNVQMVCTLIICVISMLIAISFVVTLIAFGSHLITYI